MDILFIHQDLGTIGLFSMISEKFFPKKRIEFITSFDTNFLITATSTELIISNQSFSKLLINWAKKTNYQGQFIFLTEKYEDDSMWNLPYPSPKIHILKKTALKSFKLRLTHIFTPQKLPKRKPFMSSSLRA